MCILYAKDLLQMVYAAYPSAAEWLPSTELWPSFARTVVPPDIVAAALVMKENLSLFLIAGAVALFVSLWNLVRGEDDFPTFLSSAPFVALLTGAAFWGFASVSNEALPEHGIASLLSVIVNCVTA
jgi:hypothetical protein